MAKKENENRKNRVGVVFSTNPDFEYEERVDEEPATLAIHQQQLKVMLDKKMRGGKQVTLVSGFIGQSQDLEILGKFIKTKCGVGGTVKDCEVIIQGDVREKVVSILVKEGYKVKKVGG